MEGLLCESMGAQGWPDPVRLRGALGFVSEERWALCGAI